MPLPINSTLSLQGHSRPGEGFTTIPKQAMVVRMSEDTLDALMNLAATEHLEFEFGDAPSAHGIHIRDNFFPMRILNENSSNYEMFIRTTTSLRPSGPLKLNANVVARCVVDQSTDVSDRLQKQIHASTVAAAQKKTERKIVVLDKPPPGVSGASAKGTTKTKKKPTTKVTTVQARLGLGASTTGRAHSPFVTSVSSNSVTAASTSAPALDARLANSLSFDDLTSLPARLVHYLAVGPQTSSEVGRVVGNGSEDQTTRKAIRDALVEHAEQDPPPKNSTQATAAPVVRPWRLKPHTWLAVRPYTFPIYIESERISVARTARQRLKDLGVREDDPMWEHVRFQRAGGGSINTSSNRTTTTKKGKAKSTASGVVKVKSEAVTPSPLQSQRREAASNSVANGRLLPTATRTSTATHVERGDKDVEKEEGELSASATPPRVLAGTAPAPAPGVVTKKLPGSKPSGTATAGSSLAVGTAKGSLSSTTPVPHAEISPSAKRTGPVDARALKVKREPPQRSVSARPAPPIPMPVVTPSSSQTLMDKRAPGSAKREQERTVTVRQERAHSVAVKHERTPSRTLTIQDRSRDHGRESERVVSKGTKRKPSYTSDEDSDESDWVGKTVGPSDARKKARMGATGSGTTNASTSKVKADPDERSRTGRALDKATERVRGRERELDRDSSRRLSPLPPRIKRELSPAIPPRATASSRSRKSASGRMSPATTAAPIKRERVDGNGKASANGSVDVEKQRAIDRSRAERERQREREKPRERGHERGGSRARRIRAEYTSSESDEDEKPLQEKLASRRSTTNNSVARARTTQSKTHHPSPSTSTNPSSSGSPPTLVLPTDSAELRARYSATYVKYIDAFHKMLSEKHKIDALLRRTGDANDVVGRKSGRGSSISGDSELGDRESMDGDVEMMDPEELERLSREHRRLYDELESIQRAYQG